MGKIIFSKITLRACLRGMLLHWRGMKASIFPALNMHNFIANLCALASYLWRTYIAYSIAATRIRRSLPAIPPALQPYARKMRQLFPTFFGLLHCCSVTSCIVLAGEVYRDRFQDAVMLEHVLTYFWAVKKEPKKGKDKM